MKSQNLNKNENKTRMNQKERRRSINCRNEIQVVILNQNF